MYGTEDDMLWEDEDDTGSSKDEKTEIDEDVADPFKDRNSMKQFNKLFGQSFEGFLMCKLNMTVKLLDKYIYMF